MRNQRSVEIAAPVELVFGFAANYENDPRWRSEVHQMRYTSGRPVGVGTRALETSRILGRELQTTTIVTDYEENRRVASKSVCGPVPIVASRDFEAIPNSTRFTYSLEGDVSGVLLFRLARPILARWYRRRLEATPALTSVTIRPTVDKDRAEIKSLVRGARINPRNLHWRRFLVAEDRGRIVGVRQVKVHKGGTREVASGVVLPEYRRRGVSARLMRAVLSREHGPLYLMCDEKWSRYYERFGFHRVQPFGLPADFRREYRTGRVVTSLLSLFARRKVRILAMKRDGHQARSAHDELGTLRRPDHFGTPAPEPGATLTDPRKGDRSCTA